LSAQVAAFVTYLQAECGLSKNTLAAYRTDQFVALDWLEQER